MSFPLRIKILTPTDIVYEGEGESVGIQTPEESFGILPGHISYFAVTSEGSIRVKRENHEENIKVGRGAVIVERNIIHCLVEYARRIKS